MSIDRLSQRFPSKCAFITGAGSGLGASFTKILYDQDWTLHLADKDETALRKVKDSLGSGGRVQLYQLDVSDRAAYQRVVNEALGLSRRIDVLINNAGIGDGDLFQEYQPDAWERMIQINLMGVFYGTQLILPSMKASNHGLILSIGSAAGFMNAPGMSAYNVSKAGVFSLSETLHYEMERYGVQVSVATPTFFPTNIMSDATGKPDMVRFAERQMKRSKVNSDEVATSILSEAAKGTFHILTPADARKNYLLKKYLPGLVRRLYRKMMKRIAR